MTEFPKLFSPTRIGKLQAKNRIVFQANKPRFNFEADYDPGDRYIGYQEARARGGAGVIVLEYVPCHLSGEFEDEGLPSPEILVAKYRRITNELHKHGALVLSQIVHAGRERDAQSAVPSWGFSAMPAFLNGAVPHEMTVAEIHEIIDAFAKQAQRLKAGGLDGVEIHATHGGLVQQSFSPFANVRQDEYGGDFQRRTRFAVEILAAVRDVLGPDLILGIRVSGDDWIDGGINNEGIIEICKVLVGTGKLDYVNVCAGFKRTAYAVTIGTTYVPPGILVPYAAALKEALPHIPIWTSSRIKDPAEAEAILEAGQADMIGMTRALIADPELPRKALAGDLNSIRECTSCGECHRRLHFFRPVRCSQNAEAGREYLGGITPATDRKRVLVIGGGPAGLEAARVAAERGHEVILCEASDDIGGQIRVAVRAPTRQELDAVVRYRRHELKRLGVEIRLNTKVDADLARSLHPGAIVLATGAVPYKPSIPGADQPHVLNSWEVLSGSKPVGNRVALIDSQGEFESMSVADYLLEQDKQVEIITPSHAVAQLIDPTHQIFMRERLYSRGARFTTSANVVSVGRDSLEVCHVEQSSEQWTISAIDTVVFTTGYRANDALRDSLAGVAPELHFCGDCAAPRRMLQAVADGYRVGALL